MTIIAVEAQPARTRLSATASRGSTVSAYFCFTATTRAANQHLLIVGSQSVASKAHLPPAPQRFTPRRGEGEVEEVGREAATHGGAGSAESAVVGLGDGDDMLDIGVAHAAVMPAGVGTVDPASHGNDDLAFDGTRIGVVAPVVGRAAVLGRDGEAAPGVGGGVTEAGGEEGCDGEHGERDRCRAPGVVSGHDAPWGGRFVSNDPIYLIDRIIWSVLAGIADPA